MEFLRRGDTLIITRALCRTEEPICPQPSCSPNHPDRVWNVRTAISAALWTPRDFFQAIITAVASCSIDGSVNREFGAQAFEHASPKLPPQL
jgi:hypothetical protein